MLIDNSNGKAFSTTLIPKTPLTASEQRNLSHTFQKMEHNPKNTISDITVSIDSNTVTIIAIAAQQNEQKSTKAFQSSIKGAIGKAIGCSRFY